MMMRTWIIAPGILKWRIVWGNSPRYASLATLSSRSAERGQTSETMSGE
jgi:hypothetical protein